MNKKLLIPVLALFALPTLAGCGSSKNPVVEGPAVCIHYQRPDGKYDNWDLWLWERNAVGAGYAFNGTDNFGVYALYSLDNWSGVPENDLGFIIRKGGDAWTEKDCGGSDLFIVFSQLTPDEDEHYHIYMKSGDSNMYVDEEGTLNPTISMSVFATETTYSIRTNVPMASYKIFKDDTTIVDGQAGNTKFINKKLPNSSTVDYTSTYMVEVTFADAENTVATAEISKTLLYGSEGFGNVYNYDGDDLGATYSSEATTFKVWSPFSSIKLRIYDTGTPASLGGSDQYEEHSMSLGEKGVHSLVVNGDLEGKYYTYVVTNSSNNGTEIVDPYAKSCGVNGLRGMIVDFSKTNPEGWNSVSPSSIDRKALTVYETHVADVTSSATWTGTESNRKLFKGMYETGTTYQGVKTGFDHIKELGVNAVQILPLFDQANDEVNMEFNWGYNPLNYNCVEGGYSSNPYDGYARIKEFKELVKAYNEAGIDIIMDVVYNHVNGANGSNFDVLMPGYYFRYDNSLQLSNGSGCGNETASEHYMMRKFMIESTKFWASEYKLRGFRFDLMGLHDLTTMNQLVATLKEDVNENIVVYGEPWAGGTAALSDSELAKQINGNSWEGYGAFNDQMRDALIKGGLSAATDLGWITNNSTSSNTTKIVGGLKGYTSAGIAINDPDKTVNYVTCHDNYTLYDRAIATKKFTANDADIIEKMNVLANSIVFTSQGTSFMLAGEEMLRTKQGNSNSYNASYQVNELDYSLKVAHPEMFENYQKLIAFKQNNSELHYNAEDVSTKVTVETLNSNSILKITTPNYMILHRNGVGDETLGSLDLSGYNVYWSTLFGTERTISNNTNLYQYETLILTKN